MENGTTRWLRGAFEPELPSDFGCFATGPYQDIIDADGNADVLPGWVTYFARNQGKVPPLPAPVLIEPVE